MEELHKRPLIGRGGPIAPTTIPGTDFVLKNHIVQLLRQNCQINGFKDEDANEHLDKYLSISQFIKQNRVSQDIINLNLFPFSLTHEAESWFYHLKTHYIHTWEEMVSKFLSKYYPYSKALQLRKDILNFWQLPAESDAKVYYDTTIGVSAHYSETTFALSAQIEVLGKQIAYISKNLQHEQGPGHPNTVEYTYSDESDEDEPSEADKSEIDPLIRESMDTFFNGG
ncbi:reverse transcriptase domain-containing protein [Tanacetum coccineum]